ncbi:hypothetical protein [Culicoidibacter larvae]|uniref:Lipoprotein n=1 Tax=Culicoidibacter larvae TaxID=2579976 RepID=A0A5R8QF80_9FIRM|nr:hypothetical protein [Culicoidibacter larvae]TLG76632.1 hypothetical protein FEZ08_03175 [Culicoidibacter larvae]
MRKKFFALLASVSVLVLALAGCTASATPVVANSALVTALTKTNTYLLKNPTEIQGELSLNITGTGSFQGSDASISFVSNAKENTITYGGALSSETVIYVLNQLFDTNIEGAGVSFDLASFSDGFSFGDNGNFTGNYLKFDSSVLDPFYKANELYLSSAINQADFGAMLTNHITATTVNADRSESGTNTKTQTVTTITLTGNDLANLIPLTNFSADVLNQKMNINLIQNEGDSMISRIEFQLLSYNVSAVNDIFQASVDVTLAFDLTGSGV